jgi:hypothetical protein
MPTYFRFGFGPFRFSQRLGRTQAQKRTAAKAQAQRQQGQAQRRQRRATLSVNGIVTARTPEQAQVRILGRDNDEVPISMIGQTVTIPCTDPAVTEGQGVHLHYRYGDGAHRGVTVDPAIAAREAERQRAESERQRARADRDARTHRYRVADCHIDVLSGGGFALEAEGLDPVRINLTPRNAQPFLPLKRGDIVQVTLAPGNAGLEEFWQLHRANGAKPRSAVSLTRQDMEWFGLISQRSED